MTAAKLEAARLRLCTYAQFEAADLTPLVREIARRVCEHWGEHRFVVYDLDGDERWLLLGDDREELIRDTMSALEEHELHHGQSGRAGQLSLF